MKDDTEVFLVLCGIASVIGALTGLGLSFTALSPLIIGGIVAAAPSILLTACLIYNDVKTIEFLAMENIIVPIAKKVNEYIISPIIECFSSKKQDV